MTSLCSRLRLGSCATLLLALSSVTACSSVAVTGGDDVSNSAGTLTAGESSDGEAEAEEGTSEDDGGNEDGDGGPLDIPGEDTCEESCDPWDLESCGSGYKCSPVTCFEADYRVDDFACRPITGEAVAGESCEAHPAGGDTCAPGHLCWQVDPATGEGHCEPLCGGVPDMPICGEDRVCTMFGQAGLSLCLPTCDPLSIDCPAEDATCLPVVEAGDFACLPDASEGGGAYGETCEFSNACAPGLLCVESLHVPEPACEEGIGCCTEFCELGSQGTCSGEGQACVPFTSLPGNANFDSVIGICSAAPTPGTDLPQG